MKSSSHGPRQSGNSCSQQPRSEAHPLGKLRLSAGKKRKPQRTQRCTEEPRDLIRASLARKAQMEGPRGAEHNRLFRGTQELTLLAAPYPMARLEAYNRAIMSNLESPSVLDICARVKHLGYTTSGRVRLYGEEFEVISEPFPEANGIAVHAKSRRHPEGRVLRLPATVLQSARGHRSAKAA